MAAHGQRHNPSTRILPQASPVPLRRIPRLAPLEEEEEEEEEEGGRDCERPAEEQHEAPARARAAAAPASWACAAEAAGASALGGGLVVGHEAEHEGLDVEDLSFVPWFMVDSKWAAAASVDCFRLSTRCS
ncbi:unnamed protein product, partial [Prorocentrum cordatum]